MAHETETRRLELGMAEFASTALAEQASRYAVAEEQLVKQAVRHWRRVSATDRPSARVPRFAQPRRAAPTTRVRVELESTRLAGAGALRRGPGGSRSSSCSCTRSSCFSPISTPVGATAEIALEDEEGG